MVRRHIIVKLFKQQIVGIPAFGKPQQDHSAEIITLADYAERGTLTVDPVDYGFLDTLPGDTRQAVFLVERFAQTHDGRIIFRPRATHFWQCDRHQTASKLASKNARATYHRSL